MPSPSKPTRRAFLASTAIAAASSPWLNVATAETSSAKTKSVAAVLTAYEHGLHADVLIGKILEGWKQDGGPGPRLTLASMYVDQFTDRDMARGLSQKYGFPIFETIEEAVTVGGNTIPVDGVISIGEHGDYPWNDKQQHLYPRRRFFKEITDTFVKYDRVVPVFNDKHLGPVWKDAKWMYDRAVELNIPFMAGSSMAVGYRTPEISVPPGSPIEAAVGIGYSGLDIYGSHALEFFQCHVEQRPGAEQGVRWVQCLQGDAVWQTLDDGLISQDLFDAALATIEHRDGDVRQSDDATLFLFQYTDGLLGAVFMLPTYARGTSVALQVAGKTEPLATRFDERREPRYPHFAWLLKGIETMVHTGRPTYPVERTLLTSGILDRALTSLSEGQTKRMTPELEIAYQPANYGHAPLPRLSG
ncbi:hypothetical protein CA51_42620 [Rosistilla oblonga]|uniref:hypothetical protein n=1 Tax=Rosistilla oblonga TaxID=2527990 RepID=UPI00118A6074|nr:hypothetical protein [Rosistilla oblonga]QDV14363.1 hypothetical protein CA51_42620 [Rosistilla oblonga]